MWKANEEPNIYLNDEIFVDFNSGKVINASNKDMVIIRRKSSGYKIKARTKVEDYEKLKRITFLTDPEDNYMLIIYRSPGNCTSIKNLTKKHVIIKHCNDHYLIVNPYSTGNFINP